MDPGFVDWAYCTFVTGGIPGRVCRGEAVVVVFSYKIRSFADSCWGLVRGL